jgi:hypothetical protein
MWEPRRLTALWASTACYRYSFTFYLKLINVNLLFNAVHIMLGSFFNLLQIDTHLQSHSFQLTVINYARFDVLTAVTVNSTL